MKKITLIIVKTRHILSIILMAILIVASYTVNAQVAVTTDGSSADSSAMLDVKSSDKGMLIPRMTQTEIEAINNPANGLIVFNTTDDKFYAFVLADNKWKEILYGSVTITPIPTVYNPTTNKTWMDRNLGASQVATSSTDTNAYGDLYQWGRGTDGHEKRTSATTSTLSSSDNPGHGYFITNTTNPKDWRSPQNDSLWQGVNGINNPCPSGFRLPTEAEWEAERQSWTGGNNAAGAFASPLKLPMAGYRSYSGVLGLTDYGQYWASTIYSIYSRCLFFSSSQATSTDYYYRGMGCSVRCIKN